MLKAIEGTAIEGDVMPPPQTPTEQEMDDLIMRRGLAWLVESAISGDARLTAIRVKAILGAADAHLRSKGGRTSHRLIIEG